MNRCPRCQSPNKMQREYGVLVCQACGERPNGEDPGLGSQAYTQLGLGGRPGAEKHTHDVGQS